MMLVGRIDGAFITAEVFLDREPLTRQGPLWLTLDQWNELRAAYVENESDSIELIVMTEQEYIEEMGEMPTVTRGFELA